jgi:hypothetical protein
MNKKTKQGMMRHRSAAAPNANAGVIAANIPNVSTHHG